MTTDLLKLECVAWRFIRWDALIIELERAGWKPADIANALAIPPTTVSGWKNEGKEPRYSHGDALLMLHRAVFGIEYTQKRITSFRESAIKAPATAGQ